MWFAATEAATAAAYNIHNAAYYLFIYKYISYLTSRQTDDDCQGIIIIVTRLTTRMCVRGVCLFTVFIIIIIIFYFTSSLYYLRGKPSTLSYGARAVENYRLLARLRGAVSLSSSLPSVTKKRVPEGACARLLRPSIRPDRTRDNAFVEMRFRQITRYILQYYVGIIIIYNISSVIL